MATVGTLQDLFTSSGLNTQNWTQFTGGSATFSFDVQGGAYAGSATRVNFPATTSSSTDGDLTSAVTYDLTNSSAILNVLGVSGAAASNSDCELMLRIDGSNYLRWVYEAGTLFAQYDVAGSRSTVFSVSYDPVAHAWWRIRELAGIVYWETSNNGVTYITQGSVADPIVITALTVLIGGVSNGVDTAPAPFIFRYFNIPNQVGYIKDIKVGDGMSRNEIAN